jgi:hydrogenase maturation factor
MGDGVDAAAGGVAQGFYAAQRPQGLDQRRQPSGCGIELHEAKLPVNDTVRGVCELLGLDALNFANAHGRRR